MAIKQPNIVYLFSDQHRYDAMGCAGNDVIQTLALDRLADEGLRFSRTYCQCPVCMPSRASVITGLYTHQHGIRQNFVKDFDPQWPAMVKQLQKAGYFTSLFGKTHFWSLTRDMFKEGLETALLFRLAPILKTIAHIPRQKSGSIRKGSITIFMMPR